MVIGPLIWVITIATLLIAPHITTHEPPSAFGYSVVSGSWVLFSGFGRGVSDSFLSFRGALLFSGADITYLWGLDR